MYLKKFGTESLVLAKEVLKAGTVLGKYKGTTVSEGQTEDGDTLIKVNRSDGGSPVHVMLEDDGHWLKLMRTATLPTDANICLRISGKDIICTVTKDVNKEVELKVTCRIADPCHEKQFDPTLSESAQPKSPGASSPVKEVKLVETVPGDCTSPKAMLDCVPNGAYSFSDTAACASSLSREVSEERSPKSDTAGSDIDMDEFREEVSSTRESPSSDTKKEIRVKAEEDIAHYPIKNNSIETRKPVTIEENTSSRSPEYEYTNAESYYFDRPSRDHHSPNSSTSASSTNPKAFCEACKIQFLSVNTYQVHKKFYCKSRHENEEMTPPMPSLESNHGVLTAAFKPSADTVILRGGINGGVTPSVIQPQAIYAAISTNPLILLPCTLVPGQGLVPQNGVIPTGAPGIVLQSGIACPTIVEKAPALKPSETSCPPRKTSHPVMNSADETNDKTLLSSTKIATLKRKISEGDVLNLKKTCTNNDTDLTTDKNLYETKDIEVDQDSPLDLSIRVKKSGDVAARKSPIRRRSSVISVGHPSSPGLRIAGSPPGPSVISSTQSVPSPSSYSNESSCYNAQVPVVVHRVPPVERISPLPPVLQSAMVDKTIPPPGMMPPKLMKQGNNICDECHIVFIKYDNLVTHKKHYCAYRRRQLSAMAAAAAAAAASTQEQSSDDNSNHSGINEGTQSYQGDDAGKSSLRKLDYSAAEHYRPVITKPPQPQYCCDACGVKFSTSDTLIAHQTYYCMKKPDSAMAKASSKKGDESISTIESPFSGPEEWKCNYCDAACSSYETMRRHLLTHTEPRGYRCLLCGYKGNTIRGMRTHACEHLTEDSASVEEFMSTTVISEGGGLPLIPRTLECSDEDSDAQKESPSYNHRERTSSNNSDSVKDRILKHEKLPADLSEPEEQSSSPRSAENAEKESRKVNSVKTESNDSSSNASGNHDVVNPLAFCDVVIKTENDNGDDSTDRPDVKVEPAYETGERCPSAIVHQQSVIRIAEKQESSHSSKRKSRPPPKSSSDAKLCKACGVTFQHWSNFLTHKKFYCDSRTLSNCMPETATVQ